jgi:cupin fold WbuC family metalloprotein
METVKLIDRDLFRHLLAAAWRSPRRRVNHNFHASLQDNPHRFLNVMLRGSYFTPHRHQSPPKSETFLVLEGRLAFVMFDDEGRIRQRRCWALISRPASGTRWSCCQNIVSVSR